MATDTQLDSAQTIAREEARLSSGRFGAQEHSTPEAQLATDGPSPKALGMVGAGPASVNVFADSWDKEEDRPLRPYLPLTPGDDDELWDAPQGTRVSIVEKDDAGLTRLRKFVRTSQDQWEERDDLRDTLQQEIGTGDLWAEMFEEDGTMRSTLLHPPTDVLYSDRKYFVSRHDIDKPLTVEETIARLNGAKRGRLVSRSTFGEHRDDGVPEAFQGDLALELRDNGYFSFAGIGKGRQAKRGLPLDAVQIFDREGDIVFRMEHDRGSGWEETVRITD